MAYFCGSVLGLGTALLIFEGTDGEERSTKDAKEHEELNKEYFADLVCYGQIIVALKALNRLAGNEEAQILNII